MFWWEFFQKMNKRGGGLSDALEYMLFYKNMFYKSIEAEEGRKIRNILNMC